MPSATKPIQLQRAQQIFRRMPPFIAVQSFSRKLLESIYPRAQAIENPYAFCEPSITGSYFCHHTGDTHGYEFSVKGYIEWRSLALAAAVCQPGDGIVEIGANLGTETISFADIVGSSGSVIAFEPVPALRSRLETNLAYNRHRHVQVLPYAVADTSGTVQFQLSADRYNTGIGRIVAHQADSERLITVETITLDSITHQIPKARMLHMDVEGAEPLVLRGGKHFIATHRPVLFMEVIHSHLANFGTTPAELMTLVQDMGYKVYILRILRGLTHPSPDDRRSLNWICIPHEQIHQFKRILTTMHLVGWLPPLAPGQPLRSAAVQRRRAVRAEGAK